VTAAMSAARAGIATCPVCHLLCRPRRGGSVSICPRCDAHVHLRKPGSIALTCLFLIAAYALYVPANALPIMYSEQLFNVQADTILSGTVFLWVTGAWPLAVIVFVASIVLPLTKMLILTFIVLSVQLGMRAATVRRVRMYRVIRTIGRWSMLDIFIAAMLTGAVQLQSLANVRPGPGAIAFAAVVLLTMFAVQAFDPRLIWDSHGEADDRR
jgi:paraquat-inducible protein A